MKTIIISSALSCALLLLAALLYLTVEHRQRGQEITRVALGLDRLVDRLQATEAMLEELRATTEAMQDRGPEIASAEHALDPPAAATSAASGLTLREAESAGPEIEEGFVSVEQRFSALDSRAEELAARISAISDSFESLQTPVVSVISMAAEDDGSGVEFEGNDVIDVRFDPPASTE